MPKPPMTIRMIKDVLRLKHESGLSHASIAAALQVSKGVVSKYVSLAAEAGLAWDQLRDLDEAAIAARLLPSARNSAYVPPDYARIHQDLRRKGVTLTLLWQEYVEAHPGGKTYRHTQFCERYHAWAKSLKRSMRQTHKAGEKLFVDYAGPTIAVADGGRAHVFVAALGASSYTFACATPRETMVDWIGSMVRALTYIGGTTELIVPDNPRALIANADRYEPRANETVLDFARHYGTSVLPARARRPQDKAKVEVAVQIVERWILAKLRHQRFETVHAVDRAIATLLPALNERPFQKLPGSRASAFAALDAPALRPLPATPYEIARFRTVKVHVDHHVEIHKHRYSVPHALVGQTLEARITAHAVELLHRGQRVAVHARASTGGFTTVPEHLPAAHRAHLEWTPQRLIRWGEQIGGASGAVVRRLLEQHKHPEHGYRACLGLLNLAKRYGKDRLEAACAIALELGAYQYRHVKNVLETDRDRLTAAAPAEWVSPDHAHLRGPSYYQ
ncbi:IS21 family transposase [Cupriavidus oxalaticus]|uniref:IS21 family transposase n=1 Tax=Cupriavidus oxalaticus TaxID=96344 RepID=A0A5P3VRA1_9BURK|nr:IS21 family transposase [Cupriavidus oxalaticus]QEZ48780.1 IS21 family transposase [Cupriavidus oxalaticus]